MTTEVVGVAILAHGRVLAARRAYPAAASGRWELPGGKVQVGESAAEAAVREIREELGCEVRVRATLSGRSRISEHLELTIQVAHLVAGEPVPVEHDMVRWLAAEDLDDVGWLPSDRPFLAELRALLMAGTRLVGGNVGGAVRVGRTVRRTTGSWTPAVHDLLNHLAKHGLAGTPRVLGLDVQGREVLTYLPGRVIDIDDELPSEAVLTDAMRWLRRYHDATEGFAHDGPWRTMSRPRRAGEILCHHDFAPYNVAVSSSASGDRIVGVFDWDMAGPGTRVEDLGFAAWNWVPLYRPLPTVDAAERLRLMADAYGSVVSPSAILAAVVPRIERSIRVIIDGQAAGEPGMLNLAGVGEPARTAASLETLRTRVPDIEEELAAAAS